MPFTARPAVEKIPLAARKDLRDNYDNKKDELAKKISDLLGETYTLNVNANACYAYADDSSAKTNPGEAFAGYINKFTETLGGYLKTHGDDGKAHFNDAVSKREIGIAVEPTGDVSSTSAAVTDGVFYILFPNNYFGSWMSLSEDYLVAAIDKIPRAGSLPLVVKKSIRDDCSPEALEKVRVEYAAVLNVPDIVLDPNFDDIYKTLSAATDANRDWQKGVGSAVMKYFKGFLSQLEKQGVKGDDLLQEGLAEAMEKKIIQVQCVPKEKMKTTYNEAILEGGVCYLRAPPGYFGDWCNDIGSGLIATL